MGSRADREAGERTSRERGEVAARRRAAVMRVQEKCRALHRTVRVLADWR